MEATMAEDTIEREILIEAPVEVVWRVLTEPEHLQGWFSDTAALDLRSGGAGRMTFDNRPEGRLVDVQVKVESVEPPHRFAFRWDHPPGAEAGPENSLHVEFTLSSEGEGTRLKLVEAGFDRAGGEEKVESHRQGWATLLPKLVDYAPALSGEAAAR
jgi:uncharacterized protein YndB with AHSA1/START domain